MRTGEASACSLMRSRVPDAVQHLCCTADPGPPQGRSIGRSRVCSAARRGAAQRPGHWNVTLTSGREGFYIVVVAASCFRMSKPQTLIDKLWAAHEIVRREDG